MQVVGWDWAPRELMEKGVATEVMLRPGPGGASYMPEHIWHGDVLLAELKRLPGLA